VDIEEILGLSAFIITMVILISASIKDWKEREVPDIHWIVLSIAGLVLFITYSINLTGFRWEYILLAAGTAMIIFDIFSDKEFHPLIYYTIMAVVFIIPLYGNISQDIFRAWASIPFCFLIYVGMYIFGIVRGGADVKCLIAVSIMFPVYPLFLGLPIIAIHNVTMSQVFVFSVSLLFFAAILTIPMILYFAVRNVRAGHTSKRMFSGYRMDIAKAEAGDVWPAEDIIDGKVEHIKIPKEEDMAAIYARLKEAGQETVWVTPMIPFIIFITVAAAILGLAGNPLFLIV